MRCSDYTQTKHKQADAYRDHFRIKVEIVLMKNEPSFRLLFEWLQHIYGL